MRRIGAANHATGRPMRNKATPVAPIEALPRCAFRQLRAVLIGVVPILAVTAVADQRPVGQFYLDLVGHNTGAGCSSCGEVGFIITTSEREWPVIPSL